jgi:hypothetical protein
VRRRRRRRRRRRHNMEKTTKGTVSLSVLMAELPLPHPVQL